MSYLFSNPVILVYRVLQPLYFSDCSFPANRDVDFHVVIKGEQCPLIWQVSLFL
jgi:hypothetical protein